MIIPCYIPFEKFVYKDKLSEIKFLPSKYRLRIWKHDAYFSKDKSKVDVETHCS